MVKLLWFVVLSGCCLTGGLLNGIPTPNVQAKIPQKLLEIRVENPQKEHPDASEGRKPTLNDGVLLSPEGLETARRWYYLQAVRIRGS